MNEPCVALIYVEGYGGGFVYFGFRCSYEMELFQSGKSVIEGRKITERVNNISGNRC